MSTPTDTRQRQWFLFFLLALLPAGNAVNPCLDVDTWWHLAVGRTIVERHALPITDPYSRIGQDEHIPWVAYSWLYELFLYGGYQLGGFPAILVIKHLLGMLSFLGAAWFILRSGRTWPALGVLGLVTISLVNFMTERPWHITILGTTLTLHAAYRIRDGAAWKRFWWLPPFFILWANVHIQFVLGLGILGMGFGVAVIEYLRLRDPLAETRIRSFLILGGLCTAATLATPFHFRLYVVIWEYATQTQALRLVMELQPPDFRNWWNWPLVLLATAAAVLIARRGYPWWDLAVFGSGLFFALRMQRDLWYGVLACAAVILRPPSTLDSPGSDGHRAPMPLRGLILAAVLATLLIRSVWAVGFPNKTIEGCHDEAYPVEAVRFVQERHYPGPLFNNFNWGGYLIWSLPELPVSMDGRTNLYGEARLARSDNTWKAGSGWEADPDLQTARIVIAPKSIEDRLFPLTDRLSESERWEKVFEDKTAVVFVRSARQ